MENTYIEKTEGTITGVKKLTGRDLEAEEFSFQAVLTQIDDVPIADPTEVTETAPTTVTGTNVAATAVDDQGAMVATANITFQTIEYFKAGVYTYTVTEIIPAAGEKLSGVTYDTNSYTVTVTVTEDAQTGELAIDPTNGIAYSEDMVFNNTWEENGISFTVTKEWKQEGVAVFAPRTITFSVKKDGVDFDLTDVTIEQMNIGIGSFTKNGNNTVTLTAGESGWPIVKFVDVPEASYVVTETLYTGEGTGNDFSINYALNSSDKASNAEAAATQDEDEILIKNSETIPGNNRAELILKKVWDPTEFSNDADKRTVTYELYQVAASGTSGGTSTGSKSINVIVHQGENTPASITFNADVGDSVTVAFSGFAGVGDNKIYCYTPSFAIDIDNEGKGEYTFVIGEYYTQYDLYITHITYGRETDYNSSNHNLSIKGTVPIIIEQLTAEPKSRQEIEALGFTATKYGEYELDQDHWSGITISVPKTTGSTSWQYYVVEKDGDSYEAEYTQGSNNTLIVTNKKCSLGSVRVTKTFSGIEAGQIPSSFRITATWGTGAGAQTRQLAINSNGFVDGESYSDVSIDNNGLTCTWTISNLPLGTEVTFEESGYGINGYNVEATYSPGDGKATAAATPGTVTIRNEYTAGVELPATGGPGTLIYTVAGLMLITLAGVLLVARKRKANQE